MKSKIALAIAALFLSACTTVATFNGGDNKPIVGDQFENAKEPPPGMANVFMKELAGFGGADASIVAIDGKEVSRTQSVMLAPGQHSFEVRCGAVRFLHPNASCPKNYIGAYEFKVEEGLQYEIPIVSINRNGMVAVRVMKNKQLLPRTVEKDPSTMWFKVE